jgi:hypothetical protein
VGAALVPVKAQQQVRCTECAQHDAPVCTTGRVADAMCGRFGIRGVTTPDGASKHRRALGPASRAPATDVCQSPMLLCTTDVPYTGVACELPLEALHSRPAARPWCVALQLVVCGCDKWHVCLVACVLVWRLGRQGVAAGGPQAQDLVMYPCPFSARGGAKLWVVTTTRGGSAP